MRQWHENFRVTICLENDSAIATSSVRYTGLYPGVEPNGQNLKAYFHMLQEAPSAMPFAILVLRVLTGNILLLSYKFIILFS